MKTVLLGLLTGLHLTYLHAATPAEVGVIVDYSPPSASIFLQHNNAVNRVPAQIATEVSAGDRIDLPGNTTVTIELSDNRRIVSSGPGSWTVPAAPSMGLIATIFHRFEFSLDPSDVRTMTAITRSSQGCPPNQTIAIPALGTDARVGVGTRSIVLLWTGGCPPFEVEWRSADSKLARHGVKDNQVRLDHLALHAGSYSIAIQGADGAKGNFEVRAVEPVPALPPELLDDKSHLTVIAQSLWIADADNGNWRLEGIARLIPLADHGDRLAQVELRNLLWDTVTR